MISLGLRAWLAAPVPYAAGQAQSRRLVLSPSREASHLSLWVLRQVGRDHIGVKAKGEGHKGLEVKRVWSNIGLRKRWVEAKDTSK